MTRDEAEQKGKDMLANQLAKYCPVIKSYCRADCAALSKPSSYQVNGSGSYYTRGCFCLIIHNGILG